MKGELSENDLKYKAEAYCSSMERCVADVEAKLSQWGATPEMMEKIVRHLQDERYIDQKRFCSAFVRDKYRFARWGRMKIAQALRQKQLSSEDIAAGLDEIDETEYCENLKELLRQKSKTVSGKNEYERNTKLIRFAVGRGFTVDEVLRYIKQKDPDEFMD